MLSRILEDKKRYARSSCYLHHSDDIRRLYCSPVLVIDCAELQRADSDMRLIDTLSKQTGYWPVFTFLKSMNNLIDLASVGLIGQNGVSSGVERSR